MKKTESKFQVLLDRARLQKEVYEMVRVQGLPVPDVMKKTGLAYVSIYRYLRNFEAENPEMAEQMKKQGKDITPEDYKALKDEVARLQGELKQQKLRADFYEEMVKYGKEVYGIDLKKAGTK